MGTIRVDIRRDPMTAPRLRGEAALFSGMIAMRKALVTTLALVAGCCLLGAAQSLAADDSPFKDLPGRWVGEGRLGLKEGKTEQVKCRATYFVSDAADELKQNIRCASASGKIEVKSVVAHQSGQLSGTWNELIYNLGGELAGEVTPRGFRISVRGSGLTANMEVIVKDGRQIVEIQFFDSTLLGLTLILQQG
jgi:predicted secreted protein